MALVRNTFEVQNVGDLLREKRKQLGIDIKQVSEDTKIRSEYLLALESGNFDKFPASVYAKGFLKKYAKYLGINAERVTAMYRRETKNKDKGNIRNTDFLKKRLPNTSFNLTTNKIITGIIGLVLLGFAIYLIVQATSVLQQPELSITSPVTAVQEENSNYTTTDEQITIAGKVEIGSTLKLNGSDVNVNNLQEFEVKDLSLSIGENEFKLVARSQFGRESEINLIVVREEADKAEEDTTTDLTTPQVQETLNTQITIRDQEAYVQVSVDGNPALAQVLAIGDSRDFQANQTISISSPRPAAVVININEQQFGLENSREHIFTINPEGLVEVSVN